MGRHAKRTRSTNAVSKDHFPVGGKEARLLSHNFMYLIHSLTTATDSHQNKLMLLSLAYCCLKLPDAVSMFSV